MTKTPKWAKFLTILYFLILACGDFICLSTQKLVIGCIILIIGILSMVFGFELVHYLNKLEEENKKFEEEHKDEEIMYLSYRELKKLQKNGFIEKDGKRIEAGENNG